MKLPPSPPVVVLPGRPLAAAPPLVVVDERLVRRIRDLAGAARTVENDLQNLSDLAKWDRTLTMIGIERLGNELADLERDLAADLLAAELAGRTHSGGEVGADTAAVPRAVVASPLAAPSESMLGEDAVSLGGPAAVSPDDPDIPFEEPEPRPVALFRGYHQLGVGWRPIEGASTLEEAQRLAPWASRIDPIYKRPTTTTERSTG